jgi:hypothetical protein
MNWRPVLTLVARLATLAIVVQAGTIWVCSHWFWTAIQRHYLPAYLWSSMPAVAPSTIEVRLIWKTRPHRKPELASEDDVVSSDDGTGMALSPWARDAGWTGLTEGTPQRVASGILASGLPGLAFEGESPSDFLFLPEVCAMAVFCLALFGWFCLKGLFQALMAELASRRRLSACQEPFPSLFEECARLARRVCSGLAALHRSAARCIMTHIKTHTAATSINVAAAKPLAEACIFPVSTLRPPQRKRRGWLSLEREGRDRLNGNRSPGTAGPLRSTPHAHRVEAIVSQPGTRLPRERVCVSTTELLEP